MMKENVYNMPKFIIDKKGIYENIVNFFASHKSMTRSKIVLDFSHTNYIKPTLMPPLGLILTKLKSQKNYIFLRNMNPGIRYLLIKYGFVANANIEGAYIPQNFIKYETFNGEDDESFSRYLDNQFKNIKNNEIIASLKTHLMEIFINVKMHARTKENSRYKKKEIFTGGFYDRDKEKVIFSIANNGQTFSENIMSKLHYNFNTEREYIEWALKETNSSTINRTGGLGLTMLYDLIRSSHGFMCILSGKGYFEYDYRSDEDMGVGYELNSKFPGTVISIEIPINSIPIMYESLNNKYFKLSSLIIE